MFRGTFSTCACSMTGFRLAVSVPSKPILACVPSQKQAIAGGNLHYLQGHYLSIMYQFAIQLRATGKNCFKLLRINSEQCTRGLYYRQIGTAIEVRHEGPPDHSLRSD